MKLRLALVLFLVGTMSFAQVAPNFRGDLLRGGRTSLKKHLKPNRVLFLSFWASWCVPCLEEMAEIKQGLAKNPTLPLDVLTVNVDTSETSSDIRPIIRAHEINFPVIKDSTHKIFSKFKKEAILPYSLLIDSQGNIIEQFQGLHDGMFESLKKKVNKTLGASNVAKATVAP